MLLRSLLALTRATAAGWDDNVRGEQAMAKLGALAFVQFRSGAVADVPVV
jgi:hypothetical protein